MADFDFMAYLPQNVQFEATEKCKKSITNVLFISLIFPLFLLVIWLFLKTYGGIPKPELTLHTLIIVLVLFFRWLALKWVWPFIIKRDLKCQGLM